MRPFADRWLGRFLTVHQPFAEGLVRGVKRVENRPYLLPNRGSSRVWSPGGWIMIHAAKGKRRPSGPVTDVSQWSAPHVRRLLDTARAPPDALLSRACVVGAVRVAWQAPRSEYLLRHPGDVLAVGPFCWRVDCCVLAPEPIPLDQGALGLWNLRRTVRYAPHVLLSLHDLMTQAGVVDAATPLELF